MLAVNLRPPAVILAVAASLTLAACGASNPTAAPPPTATVTLAPGTPKSLKNQLAAISSCLGATPKGKLSVFAPTVGLAQGQGGDGLGVDVQGSGLELITWPTPAAAHVGFTDAQDRLISLQQREPAKYQKIARTALEVQQNVVIISPHGVLPGPVETKLAGCVASSLNAG